MATQLLIMADTHLPKRARDLPAQLWEEVERADVVVHAGDWIDVALLDDLEARSDRLVGVYGNNDHGVLRGRLPEVARVVIEGVRIGVVHETGDRTGRERRARRRTPTSMSSSSATATSRGTPPRTPGCGCSTPARRPTVGANPTAPT